MDSVNDQNAYLCGLLIIVQTVQQRRPRQSEDSARLHDAAFSYRVRYNVNGETQELPVWQKAFLAFHRIGKKKLEVLQNSLKMTGLAPKDNRGRYSNHRHRLSVATRNSIINHINSFKGRKSL